MADECLFCMIVNGTIEAVKVFEDERTVAFLDRFPAAAGHCLVVPRRHAYNILDVDTEDAVAVMRTAQRIAEVVTATVNPEGMNLISAAGEAAGQTIPHMHVHVLPRNAKDAFPLPWPPPPPGDEAEISAIGDRLRASLQA